MTREERLRFIDEELKGLWPQWEPTEAEIRVWMKVLAGLDHAVARQALQQCFCAEAGNYRRPRPGPLLAKARALCHGADNYRLRPLHDPTTNVYIECERPPAHRRHLAAARMGVYVRPLSRQNDPHYVWDCAQAMRKRVEQLYGGRWIAVRLPQPQGHDDLQGAPARQDAHHAILTGPHTPAQQWLQAHQARTTTDTAPADDTVKPLPRATETGEDSVRTGQGQFRPEERDSADIALEQNRRRTYA